MGWEGYFQHLNAPQQSELLNVAGRQGLLYADQLPASRNGTPPESRPTPASKLWRVLTGPAQDLEPVRIPNPAHSDGDLDRDQQEAVARALATPDVCVIQGLPRTGKSRVVAEIIRQMAKRGDRVLVLARTTAAADRTLELTAPSEEVLALRLLGPAERVDELPMPSRRLTPSERAGELRQRCLLQAQQAYAAYDEECRHHDQSRTLWSRLREIAAQMERLQSQKDVKAREQAAVESELEQELARQEHGGFAFQLAAASRRHEEMLVLLEKRLVEKRGQIQELGQQKTETARQIEELSPLAEAWHARRWWTPAWWRARRQRDRLSDLPTRKEHLQQLHTACAQAEVELEELARERDDSSTAFQEGRTARIAEEVARRRGALEDEMADLNQEGHLLQEKWRVTCRSLPMSSVPAEATMPALAAAEAAWSEFVDRAQARRGLSQKWLSYLQENDPWPARLRDCVNVVAGTLEAFIADSAYDGATLPFDAMVLVEADEFSEAEYQALSDRVPRMILIGKPTAGHTFFGRLWQSLHWDPARLPYSWTREAGRLCCRLRPVPAEHGKHLERESLADYPDIELRILALPRARPTLAEVVFPESMSVSQSKAFIFKELEELAIESTGRSGAWVEEPDRVVFRLADEPGEPAAVATLEPGIREIIRGRGGPGGAKVNAVEWQTCCLEFDREHGWDRAGAEEWIERRLGARPLGRTVRLDKPHRLHPHVAEFLSHVLFDGGYRLPSSGMDGSPPHVEFVPVPPLRDQSQPRKDLGNGPRTSLLNRKGGAGLEIDLADPRQRNRLSPDVVGALPGRGVVNLAEAQAIVRTLQALTASGDGVAEPVAVIVLYPAQAALLRLLLQRHPAVAPATLVDIPAAFRAREYSVVLVGLTRSHSHRAITFCDEPGTLTLAMSRARSRLVLFGDPGSLARRSQWNGPLEHLDEATAARERDIVSRLVQYLEGAGPSAFRMREGLDL
jgi:hypothetical protein